MELRKNMRVLVVGARGIPNIEGGAEKNAEQIFPRMSKMGAEIHLIALSGMSDIDEYKGVKLPKLPNWKLLGTDKILCYLLAPFYALKYRPHVVHFQGLGSAIMLWVYRLAGITTVVRYGSADYILQKWGYWGRLGFRFAEWQLRLADTVISVTPALAERLAKKGIKDNVVVVPNGLDEIQIPNTTKNLERFGLVNSRYILSVGRVTWQKNFRLLIKAFHHAKENGADIDKLVIVGGHDERKYVESLHPLLRDDVILTRRLPRNEFDDLFTHCTGYINSSVHEGHSNAIMEALSFRRPLLVSDIPENRDLKLPAHHYFKSNSLKSLSKQLAAMVADNKRFVANTSRFWNWDQVARETFKTYTPVKTC